MEASVAQIDKRTKVVSEVESKVVSEVESKEYRDIVNSQVKEIDYGLAENNPGFKLCMVCGQDKLPPNEDGTPKFRRFPEACPDCVWRNK